MKPNRNSNSGPGCRENYIPVVTRKETAKVCLSEILYIETELRTVIIYTEIRAYRFYGKLDEVIKSLNGNFYRCHKSCILNMEKIIRMEDGIFHFEGGETLRIGQNNYQRTRRHYIRFLMEKR